ncbi:MAG TPA: DUF3795 domain-containing protein [Dehalococcoidia bacterium]|nr:DUF3795 domain-containing protein [Dehalococcoidia bacterium]
MEGEHLASVCGLYCGACPVYRVRHDVDRKDAGETLQNLAGQLNVPIEQVTCAGCLGEGPHSPFCSECEIRRCAMTANGVTRCADCSKFPCGLLIKFSNDGIPHHRDVMKNIRRQQRVGAYEWCQEVHEQIRCHFCGVSLDWYAKICHRCGTRNIPRKTGLFNNSGPGYKYYKA